MYWLYIVLHFPYTCVARIEVLAIQIRVVTNWNRNFPPNCLILFTYNYFNLWLIHMYKPKDFRHCNLSKAKLWKNSMYGLNKTHKIMLSYIPYWLQFHSYSGRWEIISFVLAARLIYVKQFEWVCLYLWWVTNIKIKTASVSSN